MAQPDDEPEPAPSGTGASLLQPRAPFEDELESSCSVSSQPLFSLLQQRLRTEPRALLKHAAKFYLTNEANFKVKANFAQKQVMVALSNAPDAGLSAITRLDAAAGCGKTVFACILFQALILHQAAQEGQDLHYMTAPTKQLVSETVDVAKSMMALDLIAPLGMTPDGTARLHAHQSELARAKLPAQFAQLDAAKDQADLAVQAVNVPFPNQVVPVTLMGAWCDAKRALLNHYLAGFDLHHGNEMKEVHEQHVKSARLVFCTASYKLKAASGANCDLKKFKKEKTAGAHFCDEPDMLDLPIFAAAIAEDVAVLLANDETQFLASLGARPKGRVGDEAVEQQNVNDWLKCCADKHTLKKTARHGSRNCQLLAACFPAAYEDLTCYPDAPDTQIRAICFGAVPWHQAANTAGAVYNWRVFSTIAKVVSDLKAEGFTEVLIMTSYAALRELIVSFLMACDFKVSAAAPCGTAVDDVPMDAVVATARQARGSGRSATISCIFRRRADDEEFTTHAAPPGKIAIMLGRCKDVNVILYEHWRNRPEDHLERMHRFLMEHKGEEGYAVSCEDDWTSPVDERTLSQRDKFAWNWGTWDSLQSRSWKFERGDDRVSCLDFFSAPQSLPQLRWDQDDRSEPQATVPLWNAPRAVDETLWRSAKPNVYAVTIAAWKSPKSGRAFERVDSSDEDSEDSGSETDSSHGDDAAAASGV